MYFFFGIAVELSLFVITLLVTLLLSAVINHFIIRKKVQRDEEVSNSEVVEKTPVVWASFNGTCREILRISEGEKNLQDRDYILTLIQRLGNTAEILMMGPAYEAVRIMYHVYRDIAEGMLKKLDEETKEEHEKSDPKNHLH